MERELLSLLDELERKLEDFPREISDSRLGDKRFREWLIHLKSIPRSSIYPWLDKESEMYLFGSFGDSARIDYGTGHELSFLVFLLVLVDKGCVEISSRLILGVFWKYLRLVRAVIDRFRLEPAGSHGVWGLDDYHHLPFLFGAAQFTGRNGVAGNYTVAEVFKENKVVDISMFVYALGIVRKSKSRTPLHLSAPVLWSISAVETWEKVTLGLLRMYLAEVLGKRPVVQHLLFGTALQWEQST